MKQVQGFLGHHAASFTIDTSIHLLDDDLPELTFMHQLARSAPKSSASDDRDSRFTRERSTSPTRGGVTWRESRIVYRHATRADRVPR